MKVRIPRRIYVQQIAPSNPSMVYSLKLGMKKVNSGIVRQKSLPCSFRSPTVTINSHRPFCILEDLSPAVMLAKSRLKRPYLCVHHGRSTAPLCLRSS